MSVVVAYKYAANPQDASVGADGTIDWSRAKPEISEYDPVAIQLGRNVADAQGTELVGISVGTSALTHKMATRNALSKGLDRALLLGDDGVATWSSTKVASALASMVGKIEGADLLITGDSSIDDGAKMTSALAAGFLGWPCFQEVTAIEKTDEGYDVTQSIPGGTRTVSVTGPVVVAATPEAVTAKNPSMKEMLAAAKKPVDTVAEAALELAEAPISVTGVAKPESKVRKNVLLSGSDAAEQLVAALRADGAL